VTLVGRAADAAGLPADPEFRAAIMGCAEWALALESFALNPQPVRHAPVLAGIGVAPPCQP
jgi:hemoglobin